MRRAVFAFVLAALVLSGTVHRSAKAFEFSPDYVPVGETVSFQSVNYPERYIRHKNFLGGLTELSSALDKADATFIRRRGLSNPEAAVSFESINYPGYYLRHQDYRLKLQPNDGSDLFGKDASFFWRPGLSDGPGLGPGNPNPEAVSLESVNFPGYFIRHQNSELWLANKDAGNTELFPQDVSFFAHNGVGTVETVSLQSVNYPKRYIRHSNFLGGLTELSSALDKADATFIRRRGLSNPEAAVSFESINYPGYYLRHQDYRLKLQPNDGTDLFSKDASFFQRPGLSKDTPDAVSFESVNFPGYFIRHQNFDLWLANKAAGNTALFPGDTSFIPQPGLIGGPPPCISPPASTTSAVRTERLGQLTGSTDAEDPKRLLNNTSEDDEWKNAGVDGFDLGANTEHNGRLYIFTGDVAGGGAALGTPRTGADLVAWIDDSDLQKDSPRFTLHPVKENRDPVKPDRDPLFDPFTVDAGVGILPLGRTPTGAFSYSLEGRARVWVFGLWTDPTNGKLTSVLASKGDPAQPGLYLREFKFSTGPFWGVSPVVVHNADHPGLPSQDGEGLVILAGGTWNVVHLAWMQLDNTHGPLLSSVRYFTGSPDNPSWSPPSGMNEEQARADPAGATMHEQEATPVVNLPPWYSSVSAAWLPDAKKWILLYSTGIWPDPGKDDPWQQHPTLPIMARFADVPWAWSDPAEVFNPCRELAYGHYMHWPGLDDIDSRVPPPLLAHDDWAGQPGHAYGAFPLQKLTTWNEGTQELTLYYLMSTWNPYQVQVMRARLQPLAPRAP